MKEKKMIQKKLNQRLFKACQDKDFDQIAETLKQGADVNSRSRCGSSPLLRVVGIDEHLALVQLLLNHGAEVNVHDKRGFGFTPLIWAAEGNAIHTVRLLLAHKAEANAQNKLGETALFWAAFMCNSTIAEALLSQGANPNVTGESGWSPLHESTNGLDKEEDLKIAKLCLDYGAEVNAIDNFEHTPLDHAQDNDFFEMQTLLRQYGGRINKPCLPGEHNNACGYVAVFSCPESDDTSVNESVS